MAKNQNQNQNRGMVSTVLWRVGFLFVIVYILAYVSDHVWHVDAKKTEHSARELLKKTANAVDAKIW